VKRLLAAGSRNDDPTAATNRDDSVVLFVRIEGENYCCLGHVSHVSYDLKSQPVEFEWELLDFEKLRGSETFKRMLKINSS
jgi:hypothetical protein